MNWLSQTWYTRHPIRWLLLPLSWLYLAIITLRRWFYEKQWLTQHRLPVPVIIVGNISIGGTGKTPFVIWLVEQLRQAGFHPGVISRGYGGQAPYYPYTVTVDSPVTASGDEPLLIASRTQCPVVVAPNRREAGEQLLRESGCDVIIADDGLQHYALQRDIEIVIVDAARQFGNGLCLPAGPLREPRKRLTEVDYVVYNGETDAHAYWMHLSGQAWINMANPNQTAPLDAFSQQAVHAIAGIGNPNRFFDMLTAQDLIVHPHAFSDHHAYVASDLDFEESLPILMTEKDAVKCRSIANPQCWYLPVSAQITPRLSKAICRQLKELTHG